MNTKKLLTAAAVATALSTAGLGVAHAKSESWGTVSASSTLAAANSFVVDAKTVASLASAFTDTYTFSLVNSSAAGSYFVTTGFKNANGKEAGISSFSAVLLDSSNQEVKGSWDADELVYSYSGLTAGQYTLSVAGQTFTQFATSKTVGYDGSFSVTAVPEPESYAMLLAGLGLMGTIARRRSKNNA